MSTKTYRVKVFTIIEHNAEQTILPRERAKFWRHYD